MSLRGRRRVAAQAGQITFENFRDERHGGEAAPEEVQPAIAADHKDPDGIEAGAIAQHDFSNRAASELRTLLAGSSLAAGGVVFRQASERALARR